MATRYYGFTALTGGGTGALDKYPEAGGPALASLDTAFGLVSDVLYVYVFDASCTDAESVPERISPSGGSGMWKLQFASSREYPLWQIAAGEQIVVSARQQYVVLNSIFDNQGSLSLGAGSELIVRP